MRVFVFERLGPLKNESKLWRNYRGSDVFGQLREEDVPCTSLVKARIFVPVLFIKSEERMLHVLHRQNKNPNNIGK
ncbi:hypothetical protein RND71_038521 [Anisodus tanguticus]|uniref:Uncharacterized protein n=1 Tax=Anisodus tanguticus TaxID=243964 RepID=A0AAE1QZV9_9SOLA|nr:hypothetical protein RND71_038521 [Anisodus tanguticus]